MKTCPLSGSKIRFSCPKFNHIPFLRQLPIAHRTACKLRSSPVFMVRDPLAVLLLCQLSQSCSPERVVSTAIVDLYNLGQVISPL